MTEARHHAHELIDRLPETQISPLVEFLEALVNPSPLQLESIEYEPIGEEEERAVAASKEWFKTHSGIPFEELVADLGFTME
jgi:hypothetical protein